MSILKTLTAVVVVGLCTPGSPNLNVDAAVVVDILENDFDPDGDNLSIVATTAPSHGVVELNADKTVTYTPYVGFVGTDTFTYMISDGELTDTASVEIDVKAPALFRYGPAEFDGSTAGILSHDQELELDEGRLRVVFSTDRIEGRQGVFSKDANGLGQGGHMTVLVDDDELIVLVQGAPGEIPAGETLRASIAANTEYDMVIQFGVGGLNLHLNGEMAASSPYSGGLVGNMEPIVIGANQWSSTAGTADKLVDPFHGTIALVELFGDRQ